MKFRKKPVVVEAVQWTGDNLTEVIKFTGRHPSAAHWTEEELEATVKAKGLKIFTLEGPLYASVGDWIIKGVKGECYPCKLDIFKATYEKVEEPNNDGKEDGGLPDVQAGDATRSGSSSECSTVMPR